jgi:hypothetical protein
MLREDGQMHLTHIYGLMQSEQQMIVGIMHQQMKTTHVQCQNSVTQQVCKSSKPKTFGCPTYLLRKKLQDHKMIRKWSDRTRKGINLGYSSRHVHSVSLILNFQTGLVSPQYNCQYDDLFETMMGTQAR